MVAGPECVDVESLADAHGCLAVGVIGERKPAQNASTGPRSAADVAISPNRQPSPHASADRNSTNARSAGVVTLILSSLPSTSSGLMAEPLHRHRFVGDRDALRRCADSSAAIKFAATEHLRRQCAPARFARFGGGDTLPCVGALERIAQRRRQQSAACGARPVDQAIDIVGADAGSRGVVDEHEVIGGDATPAMRAGRPAPNRRCAPPNRSQSARACRDRARIPRQCAIIRGESRPSGRQCADDASQSLQRPLQDTVCRRVGSIALAHRRRSGAASRRRHHAPEAAQCSPSSGSLPARRCCAGGSTTW